MDKQTGKLIARIAENLPDMDSVTMQGWIDNPKGLQKALSALSPVTEVVTKVVSFIVATYKTIMNYDRSIADSLKAGKYDYANPGITNENFPSSESGEKEAEFGIFHFNKNISSEDAIAEIEKAGYHAATMKEMLRFGEKHPDIQRKFPVIALGSVAKLSGGERVGRLYEGFSERYADLGFFGDGWRGRYRFLAVRN